MHRMLIERIENRILVGIIAFVGIMVLVGWVAINENARMASFSRQYDARSIERGAELFAGSCSTCHGTDGLGILGRAPGLNNPALFGHDFLADWNAQLAALTSAADTLEARKVDLQAELAAEDTSERRKGQIETELAEIDAQLADPARQEEIDRITAERDAQMVSMQAAIDAGYNPEEPDRLAQLGWGGTTNSFILTTLIHGRPTSISYWPQAMPAWSNIAGGPMREDQIQDVANYIQNWDKGDAWTLEDLLAVRQFAIVPGQGGESSEPTAEPVGADVEAALTQIAGLVGDPARGQQLYENREQSERGERLGCVGCHGGGLAGPNYEGTWERVLTERPGPSPEHYVVESILQPAVYIVDPWPAAMPADFGARMSAQDLADVLEYIKASDPNYVAPEGAGEPVEGSADAEAEGDQTPGDNDVPNNDVPGVPTPDSESDQNEAIEATPAP
jgi:mono/diheme cytochrome c family protein